MAEHSWNAIMMTYQSRLPLLRGSKSNKSIFVWLRMCYRCEDTELLAELGKSTLSELGSRVKWRTWVGKDDISIPASRDPRPRLMFLLVYKASLFALNTRYINQNLSVRGTFQLLIKMNKYKVLLFRTHTQTHTRTNWIFSARFVDSITNITSFVKLPPL